MTWNIGDKAYCAETTGAPLPTNFAAANGSPRKGHTYLVVGFFTGSSGTLGLQLAGYPVTHTPTGTEVGWIASYFRKLLSRTERERATATKKESI